MKNFKYENNMVGYFIEQLNFEPNISIVLSKEYLNCVLEGIDFECKTFTKEINSEHYTYMIDKYEGDCEDIHVEVIPVEFDENGLVSTEIDNEFVIVQENVLDEDDIAQIYADEEFIIVGYDYDMGIEFFDDEDDEIPEEINDLIEDVIEDIENGKCLRCTLLKLYTIAFEDGKNSLALGLSEMLHDIVEREF